jgi:hypothetical protein
MFEIRGNMIFLMFSRKFAKEEVEMLFYNSCFLYQEFFQNVFHMNHVLKK